MKKLLKNTFSLAIATLISMSTLLHAGEVKEEGGNSINYNIGYMSEYWYRGVYQSESSVSFGADVEFGSFYAGTWWADVDKGVEYDVYAGVSFELLGMPMYFGGTGYYYSDNFDGDYEELNAGIDMGFIALDAAFAGTYESTTDLDYQHYTISVPLSPIGLPIDFSYMTFQDELSGFAYELSYGMTVSDVDVGIVLGRNSENSTAAADKPDDKDTTYATFSLGYSF